MNEQLDQPINQGLNVSDSILQKVQIGGIAGHDLIQIQGEVGSISVLGTVQVNQSSPSTAKPLNHREYRWRCALMAKVKQFWIDGFLSKSLHTKVSIDLGFEKRSSCVENHFLSFTEFSSTPAESHDSDTTITDIFEDMGSGRTLLILGEPGSGKTVTLLKLLESLISNAENDMNQPLPVVINLSSWAKQRSTIFDWLVKELHKNYGVSKSVVRLWLDHEQLLLMLDGLDEVDLRFQNECVRALNDFIQDYGLTEIVICSRVKDYENLSERLKLRSAIYVQPLTVEQISFFLEQAGESLSALKTFFYRSAELRDFVSSPLLLSIMCLTYQGCSIETFENMDISCGKYKPLFENYIERMLSRRSNTRKYSREETLAWITWLAQQMRQNSESFFLIEQLQPSCLAANKGSYYWSLFLSITGVTIVNFILAFGLSGGVETIENWFYLCAVSLMVGLYSTPYMSEDINPVERIIWSWESSKTMLAFVLSLCGFTLFMINIFTIKSTIEGVRTWYEMLSFSIIVLASGGFIGFVGGFKACKIERKVVPNQGIINSAKNMIIGAAIGSLVIGIPLGLISADNSFHINGLGVRASTINGLRDACLAMPLGAQVGGILAGGGVCIKHIILRIFIFLQGNAPCIYTRFLDYATERLFMQKVGGGYIFVHRMLLEHFSEMNTPNRTRRLVARNYRGSDGWDGF